jgi:hypothetical protein
MISFSFAFEPSPAHAVAKVNAVGKHGEGGGLEAEFAGFGIGGLGPTEGPALKTFRMDPEASAIPVEELEKVAGTVDEDEDGSAAGIVVEVVDDLGVEPVERFAHVAGFEGEEDAQASRES